MQWLEITVNTAPENLDRLTAELETQGVSGLVIDSEQEYETFLEQNRQYWDYVDEELRDAYRGVCRVKFYYEDSDDGRAALEQLRGALEQYTFLTDVVRDEDWENNWKQYYKPLTIGRRLLIVPQWEETPETDGREVLRLDPGLIFGTGSHATTRMCLEKLQELPLGGKRVLDLGCGSGILAIGALLLGAAHADGCDIDPKAPDVAMDNAALNGIGADRFHVVAGDVLAPGPLRRRLGQERYDIVLANIVADVIIALSPAVPEWLAEDGVFICSGIIEGRQQEVKAALTAAGFEIAACDRQEDWYCMTCRRKKQACSD